MELLFLAWALVGVGFRYWVQGRGWRRGGEDFDSVEEADEFFQFAGGGGGVAERGLEGEGEGGAHVVVVVV